MEIRVDAIGSVTVVAIAGDLDGSTAPRAQEEVLTLLGPGVKILLDLTTLDYMSSAGARLLLLDLPPDHTRTAATCCWPG